MVAHYHGQIWNAAEFARSMGTTEATARRYLDLLAGAYMVRILPPWYENLKKRQVRAPRIYVKDSGILHSLLEVGTARTLAGHTKLGASFEGFAIEQVLSCLDTRSAFFWRSHSGAELDLMVTRGEPALRVRVQVRGRPAFDQVDEGGAGRTCGWNTSG